MSESEQNENESSVIKELRQQLKDANARLKTLEPIARETVFKNAGVDLSDPRSKFFADRYDGELTVEAIREVAEPAGFVASGEAKTQEQPSGPDEQQQRVAQLRSQSTPEGAGKRLSRSEWLDLSQSDPAAAKEAHAAGLVDGLPSQSNHRAAV